ncbi:hypothetical protein Tco_1391951 [Tanacetum coccineum]
MGGVGKEGEDGANEAFACRLREIEEFSWSSIDYKFLYRSLINLQDIRSGPSSTQVFFRNLQHLQDYSLGFQEIGEWLKSAKATCVDKISVLNWHQWTFIWHPEKLKQFNSVVLFTSSQCKWKTCILE